MGNIAPPLLRFMFLIDVSYFMFTIPSSLSKANIEKGDGREREREKNMLKFSHRNFEVLRLSDEFVQPFAPINQLLDPIHQYTTYHNQLLL